eukprot:SAG11_NODE_180_length_13278_cov_9.158434_3_plen_40_part_00
MPHVPCVKGPLPEIVRPIFCSSESGVGLATHFQNEGVAA